MIKMVADIPAPQASHSLQPRALYESLADRLRERIFSHQLKPGDAMDEAALVHEFGISRTPVREALKILHYEGLLAGRTRCGMRVAVLTAPELSEAIFLHRLLTSHAKNEDGTCNGLLGRMLEIAESRLRLAYGPAFEQRLNESASLHN